MQIHDIVIFFAGTYFGALLGVLFMCIVAISKDD